jgi:hypothetical protein
MSYTQFRDGYKKETTPGTSIITAAGDTTYVFGAVSDESVHPSPVAVTRYTATGVNTKEVGAGLMWKDYYVIMGMYGLIMQNGILCWMAMGKSSTGAGPPYTHTITPTTDGSAIPSFTINHEQRGSATNEEYQFMGCKVDSLALVHDLENAPFLMAKVEMRGLKAQDGIALTNDPSLPATANTDAYVNLTRQWDVGGTPVNIDGLQRVEIHIANGLSPIYGKTWDTGTYTGMWPYQLLEAQRKQYKIVMNLHPNTIERRLWDSLISTTTAITSTFTWTRSANDYIKVTAVGPVVEHELKTPKPGDALIEQVVIEPYDLDIEVKDSIIGTTNYGE